MKGIRLKKYKYFPIIAIFFFLICDSAVHGQAVQPDQDSTFKKSSKTLDVKLYKKGSNYEIRGFEVTTGEFSYKTDYQSWQGKSANGKVISFGDKILGYFIVNYNLKPIYCSDGTNEEGNPTGECQELPEGSLTVQLPYFPNGKYADIYDPSGKKVLTIDLTSKATCNENDQCDRPIEDGENCPQDCKGGEPKIDPAVVQLAANNQATTQEAEKKTSLADLGWWGIAILIVLIAGGAIGYYVYRRNKKYT